MGHDRMIRLNPQLDPRAFAQAYERDGVVQIADFLHPDSAAWLLEDLTTRTPWGLSLWTEDGGELVTPETLGQRGREQMAGAVKDILKQAGSGFAFMYLAYPIINALLAGREPGHATHALVEFLNTPDFLDFAKGVTGEIALTKVDAQATWFRPGDFLNLHNDTGVGERRAAYTLGLTQDWRPDWGGQLLFHDAQGDVVRGFKPAFNVWTVFKTPQWHSVAPVAAFANGRRQSIVGWLRDDPPLV